MLRTLARKVLLTPNTIRYRIEYRIVKELIKCIPSGRLGDHVLDAGAGSGEMGLKLQRDGLCTSLTGIEPFDGNFALLRRNYGNSPTRTCHHAGLEKIPLPDASVDGVLSTQVFEHIEDDHAAARELFRVLRPGGAAVISTPHPPEIFPNDGHVRPGYTVSGMKELFEGKGFQYAAHLCFFTQPTLRRVIASSELGAIGKLLPIGWADREAGLTQQQILDQQPYGLACLFYRNQSGASS